MADITAVRANSPSAQAYQVLHFAYTIAPLVAGADKFMHWLVNWDQYVAPAIALARLSVDQS
jgi:hypothetical protein